MFCYFYHTVFSRNSMMYLNFAVLFFTVFIASKAHADALASHTDVAIFRELKRNEIQNEKAKLKTGLDLVGALAVLESEFNLNRIDSIAFSKLVLGMLTGHGYTNGVTSKLTATPAERSIIERIVKIAAVYGRDLNFNKNQIWYADRADETSIEGHAKILNQLVNDKNIKAEDPHFDYTPQNAEQYRNLDQVIDEIVMSYQNDMASEMLVFAQTHSKDPLTGHIFKQFILTFHKLSVSEKLEIVRGYGDYCNIYDDNFQAVIPLANDCSSLIKAKAFMRTRIEQRVLTPEISGLIDAIPSNSIISSLDPRDSTLDQRNAIREFLKALDKLKSDEKEICLNVLFERKKACFVISAGIGQKIKDSIDQIVQAPVVKAISDTLINSNVPAAQKILACKRAILNLPDIQRDVYYQALIAKIRTIIPTFTVAAPPGESKNALDARVEELSVAFKTNQERLIKELINARVQAITPPRELISPAPVVANPVGAVDSVINLDSIDSHTLNPVDYKNADFESRLKTFFVNHWSTFYKPEGAAANTRLIRDALETNFSYINDLRLSFIDRRKLKVTLVETILQRLEEIAPEDISILEAIMIHDRDVLDLLVEPSHVYTNMEKIKKLPSTNWDGALENYVFNVHPDLRKRPAETDAIYWERVGNYTINVYNTKIKPHVYPDGLSNTLINNQAVDLLPFITMFTDSHDASQAINLNEGDVPDINNVQKMQRRNELFNFEINPTELAQKNLFFKSNLADSYEKVHQYTIKTLVQLFGIDLRIPANLNWTWFYDRENFSAERIELCKKVLLIFAYFDRAGNNYADDYGLIGTLLGRFTHCSDGKKTGIESVSRNAVNAFEGADAVMGNQEATTFDEYLKKIILNDFKNDTITTLCDHPRNNENVSIVAKIKFDNQQFWNVRTETIPWISYFSTWDYSLAVRESVTKDVGETAANAVVKYFYQHIYAGPHELVNTIYSYLKSVDSKKRKGFFGLVCTMLAEHRPFADWTEDGINYEELVQQRYCENLAAADAEPDYIFTRKGIETVLFYAGYLAWSGAADKHPLIADWQVNLRWLHQHHQDDYAKIYTS